MIRNGRGEKSRALVSQLYKSRSPPKTTRRDVLIKQIKSAETVPPLDNHHPPPTTIAVTQRTPNGKAEGQ